MLQFPRPKSKLDVEIDRVTTQLAGYYPVDSGYEVILERLKELHKMREETKPRMRVSPDVLIQSATHILGIAMIIRYEEFNIITTKALSFVPRVK